MGGLENTGFITAREVDPLFGLNPGGPLDISAWSTPAAAVSVTQIKAEGEYQPGLPANTFVFPREVPPALPVGIAATPGLPAFPVPIGIVHHASDSAPVATAADGDRSATSGLPVARNLIVTGAIANTWKVGMGPAPTISTPVLSTDSLRPETPPRRIVQRPVPTESGGAADGGTVIEEELPMSSSVGADMHDSFSPFDRSTLERALDQFLDHLGQIDAELYALGEPGNLIPQIIAAAAALSIAEALRRRVGRRWDEAVSLAGDEEAGLAYQPGLPGRWDSEES